MDDPIFSFRCISHIDFIFPFLIFVEFCVVPDQDTGVISSCQWLTLDWLLWINLCKFVKKMMDIHKKSFPHSTSAKCTLMQGTGLLACIVFEFEFLSFLIPISLYSVMNESWVCILGDIFLDVQGIPSRLWFWDFSPTAYIMLFLCYFHYFYSLLWLDNLLKHFYFFKTDTLLVIICWIKSKFISLSILFLFLTLTFQRYPW